MASHDPTVTRVGVPDFLVPTPAGATALAAAPVPATSSAASAPASPAPLYTRTLMGEVTAICAEAQEAAFPGASAPVTVRPSARDGADYQNNSALVLHNAFKAAGALPDGVRSPRDVATRLAEAMSKADHTGILAKTEVAGAGFINIYLSTDQLAARVRAILVHGLLPPPSEAQRVVVDFSSPNVAKASAPLDPDPTPGPHLHRDLHPRAQQTRISPRAATWRRRCTWATFARRSSAT